MNETLQGGVSDRQSCDAAGDAEAVRVGLTQGRGRGLFAARAMVAGDIALVERCGLGNNS